MPNKIKAILFDLDGTLCDCTELHYESLNEALNQICGFTISRKDHIETYNGLPTKKKLELLNSLGIVSKELNSKIWELKQEKTIKLIKEILSEDKEKIELLQYLKDKYYVACVTNSIKKTAKLILKATGQLQHLDFLISNDMIKNPKPHPEGWITAMIKFKSYPKETLIVEDSPVGIKSAELSAANIWQIDGAHDVNLKNFLALNYDSF